MDVVVANAPAPPRSLTTIHVYSKMFYHERVKLKVIAEQAKNPGVAAVSIMNRVLRESYDAETDDIKEAVQKEKARRVEQREQDVESMATMLRETEGQIESPINRFLQVIEGPMNGFFDKLERRTGWTWTVIGAGPDPRKPGGEIATKSFHYGETTTGQAFFEWFPSFDDYYMVPFSR